MSLQTTSSASGVADAMSLYESAQRREIAAMTEKMPWHEVMNETALLIESLNESERRQVMAALAARFGLK